MPPPPAGPADAIAPPDTDAPPGADPGAVPSGGPGAPQPDQGQGMLPPSTAAPPGAGNVQPQGNQALGRQLMSNITGAMHYARMFFSPGSEEEKAISHAFKNLSKHFMPDRDTTKGGAMPPVNQVARGPGGGPGGAPGGAPPPMGGMGGAAGGPPAPPRGPIPMAAGGGRPRP